MVIDYITYKEYYNCIILHDEDEWDGKYRTYGEMWEGEHYIVKKRVGINRTEYIYL